MNMTGMYKLAKNFFYFSIAFLALFIFCGPFTANYNFKGILKSPIKNSNRRRFLRIAQIAPLSERVPPVKYGGTQRIISYLVEELVRRGHQVTLFAPNNSVTTATLIGKWPALKQNPAPEAPLHTWLFTQLRENVAARNFDILHFHSDLPFKEVHKIFKQNNNNSSSSSTASAVVLMTIHGLMSRFPELGGDYKDLPLISISDDHRKHAISKPNFVATVYHGIPSDLYTFVERPAVKRPYLAFLGRMDAQKLPDWAIKIAIKANIKLKMAGLASPSAYWLKQIKPLMDERADLVEFVGELDDSGKNELLSNALALLFPISWPEPFGMVMIESMACGTPVIARRMGAVPEVVEEGVSGFLFDTIEQAVNAVKMVSKIDRKGVRKAFERRFTAAKMVDAYEQVYYSRLPEEVDQVPSD